MNVLIPSLDLHSDDAGVSSSETSVTAYSKEKNSQGDPFVYAGDLKNIFRVT
jgi:hypothetical protein